jgi:hypothetical protein
LGRRGDAYIRLLRVRYPLPACVRMRVIRPRIVVVGSEVSGRDLGLVLHAASDVDADVFHLAAWTDRGALLAWLDRATKIFEPHRLDG